MIHKKTVRTKISQIDKVILCLTLSILVDTNGYRVYDCYVFEKELWAQKNTRD